MVSIIAGNTSPGRSFWSTQGLVSTGLANGGIITLEYNHLLLVSDGGLEALSRAGGGAYGGRGLARFKLTTWQCDELSARRNIP